MKGIVKCNGKIVGGYVLKMTSTANIFETMIPISDKGDYEVHVYAYDAKSGNTGLDWMNFAIV